LPAVYIEAINRNRPGIEWLPFDMAGQGKVYSSILSHPDIYFFKIGAFKIIHSPDVPENYLHILRSRGVDLARGEAAPAGNYPGTALYNAVRAGNRIFHNLDCTDQRILIEAERMALKCVHIEQGYTRCSAVVLNDEAIITPDRGLAEAAREEGFDVLLVSRGHLVLPGEEYGFLGGASGVALNGEIIFLGDIASHPEFALIEKFSGKHGTCLVAARGLELYDAGSLLMC
jgi:hypothetical protein